MNHPRRIYRNGEFISHAFSLLEGRILSVHLKDIRMNRELVTVSFEEVLPGTGELDYTVFMGERAKLPEDTPAILEHLSGEAQYDKAAAAVRAYGAAAGMKV